MMPSQVHGSVYSAVLNLLRAIKEAGTTDAKAVSASIRKIPIDNLFARHASVRPDGSVAHDMYLFRVKTPEESRGSWDLHELIETIPGEQAFRHQFQKATARSWRNLLVARRPPPQMGLSHRPQR
jgi:branched-chain amino acid transport system substrate-binding protein